MSLIWLIPFLLFAGEPKPAPTVEQLQARITQLEQQLAQSDAQWRFRLATCSGALQAANEFVLGKSQQAQPQTPRPKPEAKEEKTK